MDYDLAYDLAKIYEVVPVSPIGRLDAMLVVEGESHRTRSFAVLNSPLLPPRHPSHRPIRPLASAYSPYAVVSSTLLGVFGASCLSDLSGLPIYLACRARTEVGGVRHYRAKPLLGEEIVCLAPARVLKVARGVLGGIAVQSWSLYP